MSPLLWLLVLKKVSERIKKNCRIYYNGLDPVVWVYIQIKWNWFSFQGNEGKFIAPLLDGIRLNLADETKYFRDIDSKFFLVCDMHLLSKVTIEH